MSLRWRDYVKVTIRNRTKFDLEFLFATVHDAVYFGVPAGKKIAVTVVEGDKVVAVWKSKSSDTVFAVAAVNITGAGELEIDDTMKECSTLGLPVIQLNFTPDP